MPTPSRLSGFRYFPALLTLGVGIALSIVVFLLVRQWETRRQTYERQQLADEIASALQEQIDENLEAIATLGDFTTAVDNLDRAAFDRFVERKLALHPSIRLLAWVPRLDRGENTNIPHLTLTEISPDGWVPAAVRPEYFPVEYWEPTEGNDDLAGLDLASYLPYQKAFLEATRSRDLVVVSETDPKLIDTDGTVLFVVKPVYDEISASEPKGFVVGIVAVDGTVEAAAEQQTGWVFDLYLTSKSDKDNSSFLATYTGTRSPLVALSEKSRDRETRTLEVANQTWYLDLLANDRYEAIRTKHWRSWAALLVGLLWTHIPVTYLLTSLSRQQQIERLAQERALQARALKKAFDRLEMERAKSERLLLNILPEPVAHRLKQKHETIADSFPEVTILFADIVGFTTIAGRTSPQRLVEILNEIFSAFDWLAVHYGVEKIKTIGDAYMAASGLPSPTDNCADAIAQMAIDMQEEITQFNQRHNEKFAMRIGIHTGPVVAGVIGTNKFIYDLWGDTVNIASRMESHGVPGGIQVSEQTYLRLRDRYEFEPRGHINIKGKGNMRAYLLLSPLPGMDSAQTVTVSSHRISEFCLENDFT